MELAVRGRTVGPSSTQVDGTEDSFLDNDTYSGIGGHFGCIS